MTNLISENFTDSYLESRIIFRTPDDVLYQNRILEIDSNS